MYECDCVYVFVFLFKQKTAYEMRISDWSSDVCSSDLQAQTGRRLARSSHRMGGKTAIFGMDDDSEPKRGSILQHPEHDARIRDPMASGSNRLRACCLHQADFGHFPALKSPRRGGQRMNPEIGFACSCRLLNQSRDVERRRLIGHQRRAGNAAAMESRLVGLEHAEVNK